MSQTAVYLRAYNGTDSDVSYSIPALLRDVAAMWAHMLVCLQQETITLYVKLVARERSTPESN